MWSIDLSASNINFAACLAKIAHGGLGETCHHAQYQTAHFSIRFPQRWPFGVVNNVDGT